MWILTLNLFTIYKKCFMKFMGMLITIGDIIISLPHGFIWSLKSKKQIQPTTDPLLLTPAVVLAKRIRKKTLTSKQLITAFINRIKEVNPFLNAVVEDRFTTALEESIKVDEIIKSNIYREDELEVKYPLLGIPITVKESIAVTGMSNKAGLISSRCKASKDANIVRKVRDAGAIITAVTNTPELCLNWECNNKITGRTSNPYDNRRTSGGSSGGEAALISAAASIIGIGSDTLGSLRLPAHFCGIFSHKPTSGTVSIEGHFPDAEERKIWEEVFILGPMTRFSTDLSLLLQIICNDEKKDIFKIQEKKNYSDLTIFYMENFGDKLTHSVLPEIIEAIHKTVKHFNDKYNTRIKKWDLPELRRTAGRSLVSLIAMKGVDDVFYDSPNKNLILELFKYFLGLSKHTFSAIAYLSLHRWQIPYNIDNIRSRILTSKQVISQTLGDNAVLLCPTFPVDATYHGQMISKSYNNIYMSTFNSLGLPVTVCPVGLSKNGLPIGLQIVANENCDRLSIAVAQEMELLFGGWKSSWTRAKETQ